MTSAPSSAASASPRASGGFTKRLAAGAWGAGAAAGILSALLGLAIVTWPDATIRVVAFLFGLKLVILGVYRIVQAIAADEAGGGARVLFTLLGVLSLAIGVLVMRDPLQTVQILALLFGLFWLISGTVGLVATLAEPSLPGRGGAAFLAGLCILAGLLLLLWPGITLTALTWLVGLWLITWGLVTAALSLWIRHAGKRTANANR
ncbi:HdeD family acid-resistance protein [Spirillospora sp. CA-142024]|uniref:HdeD family acid-resistance protein n=1 Tax=Spirillospora sp. CA-142024 TaxID=3240036 RepID=UPI003D8D1583